MTDIGWRQAADVAERQVRDLITAAAREDGVVPVGEQVLRELDSDRTAHLLASADGHVVGYLNLSQAGEAAPPMAELAVAPRFRRRGIGSTKITTALA